jgi:small subunit ribosomal protein S16
MLRIRLTRVGKKNSPAYRVVVADHKRAVKRKSIEILGHYNPTTTPKELVINKERALYWISNGAQASDTVHNLMCDLGILAKDAKIKKVYAKAPVKDEKAEAEKSEAPVAKEETPVEAEETPVEAPVEAEEVTEKVAEEK